ncbi:unnamed protein product [Microthlaspi erraticum]|uniref:Uncharacterized protein n=1 Tax=Microthlaspi erraticum TaxID=1685480 RepID=A0A6D2HU89_9BRAS|nr:unnamed protein product [Microthlaspi erraticum]
MAARDPKYRIDVAWDYECGWISNEAYLPILNIEASLKKCDDRYHVGRIIAVGPPHGTWADKITNAGGIEHFPISDENINCATEDCKTGIAFNRSSAKVLIKRTTDRVDVLAMVSMFASVICDGSKIILVIMGDEYFLYPIAKFSGKPTNTRILVAKSGASPSHELGIHFTRWKFDEMITKPGGCEPSKKQFPRGRLDRFISTMMRSLSS